MFKKEINEKVTAEVHLNGKVFYYAKLSNAQWVAVKADGNLDWVEISPEDFNSMLETVSSVGASVRFTNHSAA